MPLQLGDASTERPHIIAFDPASENETKEADDAKARLEDRGFTLKSKSYGEYVMMPPPRSPHRGLFRIMSDEGDERLVWDRRKPDQVREAYEMFKDLLKKGYVAYVVLLDGQRGPKIDDFDPGLEEILFRPDTAPA